MAERKPINPKDPRAARVLDDLQRVLDGLQRDPLSAPPSYAKLAKLIGVNAATLWRHRRADPQVDSVAETVVNAGRAGRLPNQGRKRDYTQPSGPSDTSPTGFEPQPLDDLVRDARLSVEEARWSPQLFLAKSERYRNVSELPRIIFELQRCIGAMERSLLALSDISDTWLQHERKRADRKSGFE